MILVFILFSFFIVGEYMKLITSLIFVQFNFCYKN